MDIIHVIIICNIISIEGKGAGDNKSHENFCIGINLMISWDKLQISIQSSKIHFIHVTREEHINHT